jgi:hypothetical protein
MQPAPASFKKGLNPTLFGRYYNSDALTVLASKTVSGANYQTLFGNDFANYVVPANKQLRIVGVKSASYVSSATYANFKVGYGDTAVNASGSAPTNPVSIELFTNFSSTGIEKYHSCNLIVPTGKYPFVGDLSASTDSVYEVYCIEEDV